MTTIAIATHPRFDLGLTVLRLGSGVIFAAHQSVRIVRRAARAI